MINIDPIIVQAMPDMQAIKAALMWIDQTTGSEYSWPVDEDISRDVLVYGLDKLEQLIPVLKRSAMFVRCPTTQDLSYELRCAQERESTLRDTCVEMGAHISFLEHQLSIK